MGPLSAIFSVSQRVEPYTRCISFVGSLSTNTLLPALTLQKRPISPLLTIFVYTKISSLVHLQTDAFSDALFEHSPLKMARTRSQLDHSRFDCVCVTFQKHPNFVDLHNLWIGTFGFDFSFADLLTNANPPDFKASLNTIIMDKIIAHITNEASHTDAANVPHIRATLENLNFTLVHDYLFTGRKRFDNDDDFNNACIRIQSKANNKERLDITVQLNIAHLHVDFNNFDFLDFTKYSHGTAFVQNAAAIAAAATAATNNTGNTPTTLVTHGDLMNCMQAMGKNINKAVDGMKASHGGNKIKHNCVITNFQVELQERYRIRNTPFQHLRMMDCTSLMFASTGKEGRHKTDPYKQSSFMSLSGDYFILQDVGPSAEKNLRSTMTKYQGKTVYEFHKWYTVTLSHMRRYNKYLHPYELFSSDITDPKGFTVGDGVKDAVPLQHAVVIKKDDRLLWDLLNLVFEKGTTECISVQVHDGSGYAALASLVARAHPAIVPEPSKLILTRPVQGKLNILEHMHQYEHYLMLRTFIENSHASLSNEVEKQHFISGCNHSAFVEDQIRREKDVPACAHKFEPSALIVTINGHLSLPNSPTNCQSQRIRNPYLPRNALPSRPAARAHNLDMHPSDTDTIEINDDDYDDDIQFAHTAACQRTRNDPENIVKPCLVCTVLTGTPPDNGHRFEQCPLLLNHDLLKTQAKGFCSLIMRGRNMTRATLLEHANAVTFEEIESDTSTRTDRDAPPDTPNRDFHQGHSQRKNAAHKIRLILAGHLRKPFNLKSCLQLETVLLFINSMHYKYNRCNTTCHMILCLTQMILFPLLSNSTNRMSLHQILNLHPFK